MLCYFFCLDTKEITKESQSDGFAKNQDLRKICSRRHEEDTRIRV
jgi:hypothetical protein